MTVPAAQMLRSVVACLTLFLITASPLHVAQAQTTLNFQPATLTLAQGESALVAIEVTGLPASGLAAVQLRIDLDSAIATVEDPNAAFVPTVFPFAPLGGDPQCDTVRGVPCMDPAWLLPSTGRTPVLGIAETAPNGDDVHFAFGTRGTALLPAADGAVAIIRIVAQADGQTTVTFSQSLLADVAQIPTAIGLTAGTLDITVGGEPDSDGDGIPNSADNCLNVVNPSQTDTDADNFGNACDPDYNNDGTVDFLDLGIIKQAFFGSDPNIDLNDDGIVDFLDLGIIKSFFFQPPGPSGTTSASALVAVESSTGHVNTPPVIVAPLALATARNRAISIDAFRSFDADLDGLTFAWRLVHAPEDASAQLESSLPQLHFQPAVAGVYIFEVQVSDGSSTSRQRVTVSVAERGAPVSATIDGRAAGVAFVQVGAARTFAGGTTITTNGTPASTHRWQLNDGGNRGWRPVANERHGLARVLAREITIHRLHYHTTGVGIDLAAVTVILPTAAEPLPFTGLAALDVSSTRVDVVAATVPGAKPLFSWSLVSAPAQSAISTRELDGHDTARMSFTPDAPGPYLLRVDIADGKRHRFDQYLIEVP